MVIFLLFSDRLDEIYEYLQKYDIVCRKGNNCNYLHSIRHKNRKWIRFSGSYLTSHQDINYLFDTIKEIDNLL